jgi:hypothetical protein
LVARLGFWAIVAVEAAVVAAVPVVVVVAAAVKVVAVGGLWTEMTKMILPSRL